MMSNSKLVTQNHSPTGKDVALNFAEFKTCHRRFVERLEIGRRRTMHNLSRGIWTCAALYVAIGLVGIFLLAGGPGIATSSDGYGIAAIAAPAALR